jgi:hypothetical protein
MLHGVDEMFPSVDENYSWLDKMLPGEGEIELCVPSADEM